MWRVIVRVSYFHDSQSRLRNHVAALFVAMGLQNTHTGTWESPAVPLAQAAARLSQVMQALANPQAVPGVDPQAAAGSNFIPVEGFVRLDARSRNLLKPAGIVCSGSARASGSLPLHRDPGRLGSFL